MVVDAHTHAWGAPSSEHPWVNGPLVEGNVEAFSVDVVYTAEKLLADMDAVGVDEAVVVGYPICPWTDNWYTTAAVSEHDRLSGIVMLDPFGDAAADALRECMAVDGILGFRLGALCPYDRMWETFDPEVAWLPETIGETAFWEAARETGAVVQVLALPEQHDQVLELVEAYPDLTYLLDHVSYADAGWDLADTRFADLAEHDSVAVKVSEVPHLSETGFPYEDVHGHLEWLLDAFGRERVVWGSDFPNVSDEAGYADTLAWLDHVDGLSSADREWLTGRAFRRHLGLD